MVKTVLLASSNFAVWSPLTKKSFVYKKELIIIIINWRGIKIYLIRSDYFWLLCSVDFSQVC